MPVFAPGPPPARRALGLRGISPRAYYHRRSRAFAGLGRLGLGDVIDPSSLLDSLSQIGSGAPPPGPTPPAPPAGWDTNSPQAAPPATFIGPGSVPASQNAIAAGTLFTYTVNYNLQGASNFFTSNNEAIATAAQMLAGVGLTVVNTAAPATANPFSSNSAILTLQATQGFQSAAAVKALADNAFAAGVGASIISSAIKIGAGNSALNWLAENWMLLAIGGAALLILPKILDDF